MNDTEIRIELARLDERQKAVTAAIVRYEIESERRIKLASDELARRLDILNHAHAEALRVQGTYLPREMYERDRREDEVRMKAVESFRDNLQGRMWLGGAVILVLAASIAAAVQFIRY